MNRFICCLLLWLYAVTGFSQKAYFAYIQTEGEQPFFLRMNDKTYSSTASGYRILSQLKDSVYKFKAGFPQQKWPEQQFTIEIKGKDRGFLLKNFGEKGWGLFDLQTLSVQMADKDAASAKPANTELRQVSAFTEVLAKATNDPSLRERPVAIRQEEKPPAIQQAVVKEEVKEKKEESAAEGKIAADSGLALKKEETVAVKKEVETIPKETVIPENKPELVKKDSLIQQTALAADSQARQPQVIPSVSAPATDKNSKIVEVTIVDSVDEEKGHEPPAPVEYKPSKVSKRSESSTSEGFGLVYVDEYADGKKDTVRIVIPPARKPVVAVQEKPKEEKKFLEIPEERKDSASVQSVPPKQPVVNKPVAVNNCAASASEADLQKLRKKMAAETADDVLIEEARKAFKTKCYTVKQIKSLSGLFSNDAAKFQFFEAAHAHVWDLDNFAGLEAELKNAYYIGRFKTIGNKQ